MFFWDTKQFKIFNKNWTVDNESKIVSHKKIIFEPLVHAIRCWTVWSQNIQLSNFSNKVLPIEILLHLQTVHNDCKTRIWSSKFFLLMVIIINSVTPPLLTVHPQLFFLSKTLFLYAIIECFETGLFNIYCMIHLKKNKITHLNSVNTMSNFEGLFPVTSEHTGRTDNQNI